MPRLTRSFEPEAGQVAAARRFARDTLSAAGVESPDVLLLVSELATNAVLHARSDFRVSVRVEGRRIRVEVADANPRLPALSPVPTEAHSGRGLMIVAHLAGSWGVEARPEGGKVIWFEAEGEPES